MLRLVPPGVAVGDDGAGEDGRGDDGVDVGPPVGPPVGLVGVQLPLETCRPLFAPAVRVTTSGTQLAGSSAKEYGMLTLVFEVGFGPAGLLSLAFADHVTLSKMLPLTCQ